MIVTLTGATGFIGRRIVERLRRDGHSLRIVSRKGANDSYTWDRIGEAVEGAAAVVHLAGEPVSQRWNSEVKRRIRDSRIDTTRQLVQALAKASRRPETLVSASAIGYYGSRGEEVLTEQSRPGQGFLADLCGEWEREANLASEFGVRVANLRIGIVLGADGGMLKTVLPPFRAGVGGRLASGKQWMSWIHVDDLVEMALFALANGSLRGPLNGAGPNPVRNAEFTRALARALRRPAVFPVPALALRVAFGEMADVILASQKVLPEVAMRSSFKFRYPDLNAALVSLLA